MISLSISTSTSKGSIAINENTKILFFKSWFKENSHAEVLHTNISEALKATNLHLKDIDLYISDVGPGSFTGIRVSLSTIKTFAQAYNKPCLGLSSLRILAQNYSENKYPILSILNAQRKDVYASLYSNKKNELLAPKLMSANDINSMIHEKTVSIGDGYDLIKNLLSQETLSYLIRKPTLLDYPSADYMYDLGLEELKLNKTFDWKSLIPLYIRSSSAEEKLKTGELKPNVRRTTKQS